MILQINACPAALLLLLPLSAIAGAIRGLSGAKNVNKKQEATQEQLGSLVLARQPRGERLLKDRQLESVRNAP